MGTFYLLAVGLAYLWVNISIEPYDPLPSGIGDAAWRFYNVHEKFSLANKLVHRDMPLARARGVRDRALREHGRSSGFIPPLFCEHKGQSGRSSVSNCECPSRTALCATCWMGQACTRGLVCLLSFIRPPFPSQSWECRAMGCPVPQFPESFFQQSLASVHTFQPSLASRARSVLLSLPIAL